MQSISSDGWVESYDRDNVIDVTAVGGYILLTFKDGAREYLSGIDRVSVPGQKNYDTEEAPEAT